MRASVSLLTCNPGGYKMIAFISFSHINGDGSVNSDRRDEPTHITMLVFAAYENDENESDFMWPRNEHYTTESTRGQKPLQKSSIFRTVEIVMIYWILSPLMN